MTKKNLAITGILFLIFLMIMGIGLESTRLHAVIALDLRLETPSAKSKPVADKLLSLGNELLARGRATQTSNLDDHLLKASAPGTVRELADRFA